MAEMQPREPLMTPAGLAEYLGVTGEVLRTWRHRGTGPDWIKVGHEVRYRPAAVEEWLAGHEHGKKAS